MTNYREKTVAAIAAAMHDQKLSMLGLSRLAGVKYDIVRDLLRGKTQMTSAENMEKIKKALNFNIPGDIGVPFPTDSLRKIPAYDDLRIAAGPPTELHAYHDHTEFVYFRTSRTNLRAIRIADRSYSMNRVALPGQHIIIDFDDHDPETLDGKFVVACVNGDCTFKRWRRDPDRLEPYSDMPDQPTLYIKDFDDFRIVGKVIGVVSDFD